MNMLVLACCCFYSNGLYTGTCTWLAPHKLRLILNGFKNGLFNKFILILFDVETFFDLPIHAFGKLSLAMIYLLERADVWQPCEHCATEKIRELSWVFITV